MKSYWLLPATVGTALILSSPALATKLESWRFDRNQNLLEINTTGGVQPKAQLIFNPTRLVIDLRGIQLGQSQITQAIGGGIKEIRLGQFDEQTTRIVVEFNTGYNVDAKQIKFIPKKANSWLVQLPNLNNNSNSSTINNNPDNNYNLAKIDPTDSLTKPEFSPIASNPTAATQVENLQITGDGFFSADQGRKTSN